MMVFVLTMIPADAGLVEEPNFLDLYTGAGHLSEEPMPKAPVQRAHLLLVKS